MTGFGVLAIVGAVLGGMVLGGLLVYYIISKAILEAFLRHK